MDAAAWIGPAIVAAVISALVTGASWFVSERQAARREAKRRGERVRDMQTGLLAEIRASRHRVEDVGLYGALVDQQMAADETYLPFGPALSIPSSSILFSTDSPSCQTT